MELTGRLPRIISFRVMWIVDRSGIMVELAMYLKRSYSAYYVVKTRRAQTL